MKTILDRIVEQKKKEVAELPSLRVDSSILSVKLKNRGGVRPFRQALISPRFGRLGLIAEVKKTSPSAGLLCADFDAVQIAQAYESGGASCISVLTDEKFFGGSLRFLNAIRKATSLPLLRKDFILDPRQILESIEWGADAILLIVAILEDELLAHLHRLASDAGLDVLVEVHNESELQKAMAIGAALIGINNRDLRHFRIDLKTTEMLAAIAKKTCHHKEMVLVAESGIRNREDVDRLKNCGAQAFLIGESLMRNLPAVSKKIRDLII